MYTSAGPVRSERSVDSCARIRSIQPGNCSGQQHGTARGRDGSTTDGTLPGYGLRSETVGNWPVHCRHRKHLDTRQVCNSRHRHTLRQSFEPVLSTEDSIASSIKQQKEYYITITRSTGTVHTSAKTRLTSVVMRTLIRHPDCHQNLITCSLAHRQVANLP